MVFGVVVRVSREGDSEVHQRVRNLDLRGFDVAPETLEQAYLTANEYFMCDGKIVARGSRATPVPNPQEDVQVHTEVAQTPPQPEPGHAQQEPNHIDDPIDLARKLELVVERAAMTLTRRVTEQLAVVEQRLTKQAADLDARLTQLENRAVPQLENRAVPHVEPEQSVSPSATARTRRDESQSTHATVASLAESLVTLSTRCVDAATTRAQPVESQQRTDGLEDKIRELERVRDELRSIRAPGWLDRLEPLADAVVAIDDVIHGARDDT